MAHLFGWTPDQVRELRYYDWLIAAVAVDMWVETQRSERR